MQRLLLLFCLLNLQTVIPSDASGCSKSDARVQTHTYVFHGNALTGLCRFTLNPDIQKSYYFGLDPRKSTEEVCCGKFLLDAACWIEKPTFKELVNIVLSNDEKSLDSFIKSRQGPEQKKVFLKLFFEQLRLTSGPHNPENRTMLTDFTELNC